VTDEAMLLERCRRPVAMVEGDPSNVKVTTPADWALLRRTARPR
jgi:2-C-methyl-D-erythritol 4-phosphate cytidylyltransferase